LTKRSGRIAKRAQAGDLGERAAPIAARDFGVEACDRASVGARRAARVLFAFGADAVVNLVVELEQKRGRIDRSSLACANAASLTS
jgi:hypothetical protein